MTTVNGNPVSVVVLMSTIRYNSLISTSLPSVINQTIKPDGTYIVSDVPNLLPDKFPEDLNTSLVKISRITNKRTKNLSGALNTGIDQIVSDEFNPESTFVAILDDDDWWEENYLEECLKAVEQTHSDWVIPGIIRHEVEKKRGKYLSIPKDLREDLFLRGNPHIQGSNIFVKLSTLLLAGCFDEYLPSTTDRDLCIRLLRLGDIKYAPLNKHLVHHSAFGNGRLSVFGSEKKCMGLNRFYDKYKRVMNASEISAFIDRSRNLFGCEINNGDPNGLEEPMNIPRIDISDSEQGINIIVGAIASSFENAVNLLHDVLQLQNKTGKVSGLVIEDYFGDKGELQKRAKQLEENGINVRIVTQEEWEKAADKGELGEYYLDPDKRSGIPYGRTILQKYVYLECVNYPDPVAWIVDDDISIADVYWGTEDRPMDGKELIDQISFWKKNDISIVVGRVGGDPPVPAMSTMRTQLLDLQFNLLAFGVRKNETRREDRIDDWVRFTNEFTDYYYDFPTHSFGHLEFPTWLPDSLNLEDQREIFNKLVELVPEIGYKSVFRPAAYPISNGGGSDKYFKWDSQENGPVRGGNTIIIDIACLRTFFNGSPHSSGLPYRRGDTLWVILNRRLASMGPMQKMKSVISSPITLVQQRKKHDSPEDMKRRLISDSLGSAFIKTLDGSVFERITTENPIISDPYTLLEFSDEQLEEFYVRMRIEVNIRAENILLNSWRIRGLIMSIEHLVKNSGDLKQLDVELKGRLETAIDKLANEISGIWDMKVIEDVIKSVKEFNKSDLFSFLRSLSTSNRQFSAALPIYYSEADISRIIKDIENTYKTSNLTEIGKGKEGIVFTDGTFCYKYFHVAKSEIGAAHFEFLRSALMGRNFQHIARLLDIKENNGSIVLKEEFIEGDQYQGGSLHEMIGLLRECRNSGIVINNIAPKNLITMQGHLKFVDIGKDIEAYSQEKYESMCRRAYLTYRWHFRSDLSEILHRSINDTDFPEMFGYDWFHQALEVKTNHQIIDPDLGEIFRDIKPETVLDYGCGNGSLADDLSVNCSVSVYDIEMEEFWKRHSSISKLEVLDRNGLDRIQSEGDGFNTILLSLVLCSVDDPEVSKILKDVRGLVRNDGSVVIVICNPFNIAVTESQTYISNDHGTRYSDKFPYEKTVKETHRIRTDYHRPVWWYKSELKKQGFQITKIFESGGINVNELTPGADFLYIIAAPIPKVSDHNVSLMIKASSMEWRSIDFQIRHIISQLEGPEIFQEKIVITDNAISGFTRGYDNGDFEKFKSKLKRLLEDGIIDRVLFSPTDPMLLEDLSGRWFGIRTSERRSENGQPVLTTVFGLENAPGKYVLQMDSDCIIGKRSGQVSYLDAMVKVMEGNADAVTVSFPIFEQGSIRFEVHGGGKKWRTEVRNCLIYKSRLMALLPLPNSINGAGKLVLTWHRSLDEKLSNVELESYRGSEGNAYYLHVPNIYKNELNRWFNNIAAVENGIIKDGQTGEVDLNPSTTGSALQKRDEEMVVLVKGKNVTISKIRRCFQSLLIQDYQDFGVIAIDAGSSNGVTDYISTVGKEQFGDRLTLFTNIEPLTSMENIKIAVKEICTNPNSIVAIVDMDDSLIGRGVLSRVLQSYSKGSDLTVGTMIRTDKERRYPVELNNPREKRGGNVWQHLRTFKKYLFDAINYEDFLIDGEWISEADDWAYMLPMVEMARNPTYIPDIVYYYEPSDEKGKRNRDHYEETIGKIVSKKSYKEKKF